MQLLILKEFQFVLKLESWKKISRQRRQVLKSNATFVVEMYIYRTETYTLWNYTKTYFCCVFPLFSSSNLCQSGLKSAPVGSIILYHVMSRPFCSHVALLQNGVSLRVFFFVNKLMLPLVDFKMNIIKLKFLFVSCNFGLNSNLWL